jgi:hypothetical protein
MEEEVPLPPFTVTMAQRQLQLMGYYAGEIDSDDGALTQGAVEAAIVAGIPSDMTRLLAWISARSAD